MYRSAIEIRQIIEQALGNLLGTYTLPNGVPVPAIAVLPDPRLGYHYPPTNTQVTGLEVVILLDSGLESRPLTGGHNLTTSVVKIQLKQWDQSSNLVPAIEALIVAFGGGLQVGPRLLPLDKLGNIETCDCTLAQSFKLTKIGA